MQEVKHTHGQTGSKKETHIRTTHAQTMSYHITAAHILAK